MYDTILVPTDGSDEAAAAVEHGLDLAEHHDAEVHVLYVIETEATYILTVGLSDSDMDEYREYGEDIVSGIADRAEERGLKTKGVIRSGKIAEEIMDYARDNDVDNIVIAERGRGAVEKYLGSNAEKVARRAATTVTVVRPDD